MHIQSLRRSGLCIRELPLYIHSPLGFHQFRLLSEDEPIFLERIVYLYLSATIQQVKIVQISIFIHYALS